MLLVWVRTVLKAITSSSGDLRPGKLGFEQAEHVKLTLAERLDQGLRSGRR